MRKPFKPNRSKEHSPDAIYHSLLLSKLINQVMQKGKKHLAQKMVYQVLDAIKNKQKKPPLLFLQQAVDNLKTPVELKTRKIGGANYQVPVAVTPNRQETLAIRWLVQTANQNRGKNFIVSLEKAIINSFNNEGSAIKKKQNIQKMAEANKAFAHFSW